MSASKRVISVPPVIFTNTPLAPLIETSSKRGLEIAASQAIIALSSPSDSPVPIIALPPLVMMVLISAKSRFINPGLTIKSVIPLTPVWSMSSAILKADSKVVCSLETLKRF